jgi:YHS domain-containing protein
MKKWILGLIAFSTLGLASLALQADGDDDHDDEEEIAAAMEQEKLLYLTPGGIYTLADIIANGEMTRSERFVGFIAKHNSRPKPGDQICPITLTVANPKCFWIIGGKTYYFCCPPCIDEFLTLAKEQPEQILAPEEYVKR